MHTNTTQNGAAASAHSSNGQPHFEAEICRLILLNQTGQIKLGEYQKQIRDLKELFGEEAVQQIVDRFRKSTDEPEEEPKPEIVSLRDFMSMPIKKRDEVIQGVLRKKSILILASASKIGKTWIMLDLIISVANGLSWIGFRCRKGRVLYVNFELYDDTLQERIGIITASKQGVTEETDIDIENIDVWNLRGHAESHEQIAQSVIDRCQDKAPYDLIVLDPVYKMLGDSDENKAGDMNKLMNSLDRITRETGAAIAVVGHYSKGSKAGSQTGDRMSGSGVFLRATDALIELTPKKNQEDNPLADLDVSGKLREFKPLIPFVARVQEGILTRVDGAEVTTGAGKGKEAQWKPEDLLALIPKDGIKHGEWKEKALAIGLSEKQFRTVFTKCKDGDYVDLNGSIYTLSERGLRVTTEKRMRDFMAKKTAKGAPGACVAVEKGDMLSVTCTKSGMNYEANLEVHAAPGDTLKHCLATLDEECDCDAVHFKCQ